MWQASGNCIRMTRNDFGVGLPLSFPETEISEEDTLAFTIKKENGPVLVRKTYTSITGRSIEVVLTKEESAKLPVGSYVWKVDWFRGQEFLCCLAQPAPFKVVSGG